MFNLFHRMGIVGISVLVFAAFVHAADMESEGVSVNTDDASETDQGSDMLLENNHGSIVERLRLDAEEKDYLFQIPGVNRVFDPWYDFKEELEKKYGFKFGISLTTLYKKASDDSLGSDDDAASFDLDISGTWTMFGRGEATQTMLGFNVFWRDTMDGDLSPQALFSQFGSLYSTAAPYGENDPALGELWIQQKFNNVIGFRVGQIFPITAYDFFPFKNFRTDFMDFNHVTDAAIPLPGNGLGGFVQYRPHSSVMLRLGVHDANADVEQSGFDTYDDELFSIFEVGIDTGLVPRQPGRPPDGYVGCSIWHQDKRDEFGIDEGQGVVGTAVQRFGDYTPFVRLGYADGGSKGPTPVEHMFNAGIAIDNIFGQDKDRIGLGFTWSNPADSSLDDQEMIDSYYRIQLTPEMQLSPTFQVIIDPVRNDSEDVVYVWGIRTRIEI